MRESCGEKVHSKHRRLEGSEGREVMAAHSLTRKYSKEAGRAGREQSASQFSQWSSCKVVGSFGITVSALQS